MIFFLTIIRDPVKKCTQILWFGGPDGSFRQDGTASHINKIFVLLVILHEFKLNPN